MIPIGVRQPLKVPLYDLGGLVVTVERVRAKHVERVRQIRQGIEEAVTASPPREDEALRLLVECVRLVVPELSPEQCGDLTLDTMNRLIHLANMDADALEALLAKPEAPAATEPSTSATPSPPSSPA